MKRPNNIKSVENYVTKTEAYIDYLEQKLKVYESKGLREMNPMLHKYTGMKNKRAMARKLRSEGYSLRSIASMMGYSGTTGIENLLHG